MATEIRVVLAGIGGYGRGFLKELAERGEELGVRLAGVVDPAVEACSGLSLVKSSGVAVYADLADFFRVDRADLAVLATPIACHADHTLLALAHGANVLCEKPLCASLDDAARMADAARAHPNLFVEIGYNRSFSPAVRAMKADILAGVYGAPKTFKVLISWPRTYHGYYRRNAWAGKLRDARGAWILDSPLNNAAAHFMHNMLYVRGPRVDAAVRARRVNAELYRANPIESFDTCAVRCRADDGGDLFFYATHADENDFGPLFHYAFEHGSITGDGTAAFVGTARGRRIEYPADPQLDGHINKLRHCLARCRGEAGPLCGVEAAAETTRVVHAAHRAMPHIVDFPDERKRAAPREHGDHQWIVPGLLGDLRRAYDRACLPAELGDVAYARAGAEVDCAELHSFDPPAPAPEPALALAP